MKRKSGVTASVSLLEAQRVRDYCAQFDMPMGDLLRELIFHAMENAPIKESKHLVLNDQSFKYSANGRNLRGIKPGQKQRVRKSE